MMKKQMTKEEEENKECSTGRKGTWSRHQIRNKENVGG
jgi:hypothetical protein